VKFNKCLHVHGLPRVCQGDDDVALPLSPQTNREVATHFGHGSVFEVGRPRSDGLYPVPSRRKCEWLVPLVLMVAVLFYEPNDADAHTPTFEYLVLLEVSWNF
jgi:hypothetical protein